MPSRDLEREAGQSPARAATVLMKPELCAATHHVIYDFDEDCFSETSLDFPDFLENEFQKQGFGGACGRKGSGFRR